MQLLSRRSLGIFSAGLLLLGLAGCTATATTSAPSTKTSSTTSQKKTSAKAKTKAKPSAKPYAHWHTVKTAKVPILMYHSIASGNSLRVPAKQFKAEMTYLKQHHYYTLTTAEAIHVLTTKQVPQKKIVWITLDDAYRDNYTKAWPILKQTQTHATINFITGFATKKNHLNLAEALKMQASGVVDFQSHTVHHLDLNQLTDKQQLAEMVGSKTWLDEHLHQHTRVICYPAGRANKQTLHAAKLAGYQLALSTTPGIATSHSARYNLPRQRVTPGLSLAEFQQLLQP
ncbi:polysaccharide deacetylase family protein [Lactiplantibacillus daowaiensis]|uniref:Polysaccharide deacetylase family protein n=1 Tax=Lactiplantibacillus daowaiensis TaxID=2559918 RepID=A0ABW1S207_9LACO|nr:polysaccharide deacetylase family protein [Lactiplantibacillus daowaiensis]